MSVSYSFKIYSQFEFYLNKVVVFHNFQPKHDTNFSPNSNTVISNRITRHLKPKSICISLRKYLCLFKHNILFFQFYILTFQNTLYQIIYFTLSLCLVHVKYFPENKYFPEMLFSGKENIFKCLVAFQKMFWKRFSSVWLCSENSIFLLVSHIFSTIFSASKQIS